jgi:hypothetical protein
MIQREGKEMRAEGDVKAARDGLPLLETRLSDFSVIGQITSSLVDPWAIRQEVKMQYARPFTPYGIPARA